MIYEHFHTSSYDELVLIAAPDVLGNLRKPLRCGTLGTDLCQFARNSDGLRLGMWVVMTTLRAERNAMNRIVYIVGFVVIVLVVLGFFGMR